MQIVPVKTHIYSTATCVTSEHPCHIPSEETLNYWDT